jgi:hypothetical protein
LERLLIFEVSGDDDIEGWASGRMKICPGQTSFGTNKVLKSAPKQVFLGSQKRFCAPAENFPPSSNPARRILQRLKIRPDATLDVGIISNMLG